MNLTDSDIEQLHEKHAALTAEIRSAIGRLEEINQVIQDGVLPAGKSLDDIGRPINEIPA